MSPSPVDKTANEAQKPSQQDIRTNSKDKPRGALAMLRESRREFADGVMRPGTGLVGEKLYETSASQTAKNLKKKYAGALTGFNNRIHGFAFGILRPGSGVVGEKIYHSSHSDTMENLRKEHLGAAAGIKETIRKYADAAVESLGPPVKTVEPIKLFQYEAMGTSDDAAQAAQQVSMKA